MLLYKSDLRGSNTRRSCKYADRDAGYDEPVYREPAPSARRHLKSSKPRKVSSDSAEISEVFKYLHLLSLPHPTFLIWQARPVGAATISPPRGQRPGTAAGPAAPWQVTVDETARRLVVEPSVPVPQLP